MPATRRRFGQDFKDEPCREIIETSKPIVEVAESSGVRAESLRRRLVKYRRATIRPRGRVATVAKAVN